MEKQEQLTPIAPLAPLAQLLPPLQRASNHMGYIAQPVKATPGLQLQEIARITNANRYFALLKDSQGQAYLSDGQNLVQLQKRHWTRLPILGHRQPVPAQDALQQFQKAEQALRGILRSLILQDALQYS
ncbi:MAG: hypothetical protein NZ482_01815 [Gloeomargarita sp. SKYG98]|nr:hypothetical protein [Gloeomargarita sp. SKYG98]